MLPIFRLPPGKPQKEALIGGFTSRTFLLIKNDSRRKHLEEGRMAGATIWSHKGSTQIFSNILFA
jgi:hypothetical protein